LQQKRAKARATAGFSTLQAAKNAACSAQDDKSLALQLLWTGSISPLLLLPRGAPPALPEDSYCCVTLSRALVERLGAEEQDNTSV
jgi:hypothetical protein